MWLFNVPTSDIHSMHPVCTISTILFSLFLLPSLSLCKCMHVSTNCNKIYLLFYSVYSTFLRLACNKCHRLLCICSHCVHRGNRKKQRLRERRRERVNLLLVSWAAQNTLHLQSREWRVHWVERRALSVHVQQTTRTHASPCWASDTCTLNSSFRYPFHCAARSD